MVKSEAILAALATVQAGQDALRDEVQQLVRLLSGGGARDGCDVDVIEVLHDAMKGQPFTSGQAIDYAKRQAAAQQLHDALEAACIEDAQGLGILLHRCVGRPIAGIAVVKVGGRKDRVTWQLRPALAVLGSLDVA
jgi:hypothetical protein